jgi:hypothetical protein
MEYDYIIIGAGISGLYTAYNIKKINPTSKFIILEKNNKKHIGGRMNVYNFYGNYVNIGAGVGRKEKDFLLINLLKDLKIKYNEGILNVNYHENVIKIDITNTLKELKNKYSDKYKNYTFKKFALEILGEDKYTNFITYLGYTDYENEDAYETINFYGIEDDMGGWINLRIKWNELINKLYDKINHANIKFNKNIISINKVSNKYIVTTDKNKIYSGDKIIIASTINTVQKLLPNQKIYKQIHGQPFMRVYGKFNKKSSDIIKDLIKGYTIVNSPLQKIISINPDEGIYMIAYTDNKGAIYFKNYTENNETNRIFFCNEIEKTLNLKKNSLKLIGIKTFYWEIGTHYYEPLSKEFHSRIEFIKIAQNPIKNIFVVGEMISRNQGWTQGALESVEKIINKI